MELVKSSKWFKALAAVLLVAAMGIGVNAINVDHAYAADSESSIVVNVEQGGVITSSTTVSYAALQTAGKINTTDMGFLYCKGDVWNVVGTDNYVKLSDLFAQAGVGSVWAAASGTAYLEFDCTDGPYTKYYPKKAEITRAQYFYGATTASATNATGGVANEAVIAYSSDNAQISSTDSLLDTASEVLPTVLNGGDTAPRFCMGLVNGVDYTNSLAAGKRMPSNVTEITIVL